MAAGVFHFENSGRYRAAAEQGVTFQKTVTWRDSNGNPYSLVGYTARMMVRRGYNDDMPVISLTSSSGLTLGGAAGTIAILVSATTMNGLAPGIYLYDLELQSASGIVTRILEGRFQITAQVTK